MHALSTMRVTEICLYFFTEIFRHYDNIGNLLRKHLKNIVQNRPAVYGKERFWRFKRQGAHTRSFTRGEDYCLVNSFSSSRYCDKRTPERKRGKPHKHFFKRK